MTRAVLSVLLSEEAKVTGEEKTVFATNGVKHLGVNMQKKKKGGGAFYPYLRPYTIGSQTYI